jgi:hypothetical protein
MNDLYDLVPYLAAFIAFLGSAYLFTRGPKAGRFDSVGPLVQTGVAIATLGIYVGLLKVNIPPLLWISALSGGIVLGVYGSWSTTMELQDDGSIRTLRTMWYLAVLAATIGISQVLIRQAYLHRNMFNGGLAAFYFGTGTAVASNVTLLVRAAILKKLTLADIFAPIGSFNWREGTEGSPWQRLRERMASRGSDGSQPVPATPGAPAELKRPEPTAAPPAATSEIRCPNCGSPIKPGARFCRSCGQRLS